MAVITKGFIGKEDFKLWDGTSTKTFSRATITGGTEDLTKVDWVGVDVFASEGERTGAAISNVQAKIGSTNQVKLYLSPGVWAITADLTTNSNITLDPAPGAIITIATGVTLTINGGLDALPSQHVFNCVGTGKILGITQEMGFENWGADSGNTDVVNSLAMQKAIDSLAPIIVSKKSFSYDTTLLIAGGASPTRGTSIIGIDQMESRLIYTGTGNAISNETTRKDNMRLERFRLSTDNASNTGNGISLAGGLFYGSIEDLYIDRFGGAGISILGGLHSSVKGNYILGRSLANGGADYGIYINNHGTYGATTTLVVEQNYVSDVLTAATGGIGIRWINTYKCIDRDNIIESVDICHNISGGTNSGYFALERPYYETYTTALVWHDQEGYAIGGIDPNTVATWDVTASGARIVPYHKWSGWLGDGSDGILGSTHILGTLDVDRAIEVNYTDVGDTSHTPTSSNFVISADPTAAHRTVDLPTAVGLEGRVYTLINGHAAGGNNLTVTPLGAETISGESDYILDAYGQYLTIISDGANWQIIGSGGIHRVANADTSGANLAALETEVNQLKAALREYGVIKK